jgi:hypothetical protein
MRRLVTSLGGLGLAVLLFTGGAAWGQNPGEWLSSQERSLHSQAEQQRQSLIEWHRWEHRRLEQSLQSAVHTYGPQRDWAVRSVHQQIAQLDQEFSNRMRQINVGVANSDRAVHAQFQQYQQSWNSARQWQSGYAPQNDGCQPQSPYGYSAGYSAGYSPSYPATTTRWPVQGLPNVRSYPSITSWPQGYF